MLFKLTRVLIRLTGGLCRLTGELFGLTGVIFCYLPVHHGKYIRHIEVSVKTYCPALQLFDSWSTSFNR